jgi:hypothetical protein
MAAHSTYLVKINDQGLLTIEMPQMVGKYLVIEQNEEKLTITPLDLEREPQCLTIARRGQQWTMLGTVAQDLPSA